MLLNSMYSSAAVVYVTVILGNVGSWWYENITVPNPFSGIHKIFMDLNLGFHWKSLDMRYIYSCIKIISIENASLEEHIIDLIEKVG